MLRRNYHRKGSMVALAVIALALLLAGCSSKSVKEDNNPSHELGIAVSLGQSSVNVGETAVIEAIVTLGGVPVADAVVTFSADPATAGSFTRTVDTTDSEGAVATIFNAASESVVTISVLVEAGSRTASDEAMLSVTTAGTEPTGSGFVGIAVTPSLILANGNDTTLVTISVCDALGQPALEGTEVILVAGEQFVDVDGDGYWSPCCDSVVNDVNGNGTWDALGAIPAIASTVGATGQVTVNFVSGDDPGIVYIKASVKDNGIRASADFALELLPSTANGHVRISVGSSRLLANGHDTTLVTIAVCDADAVPAPDGTPITLVAGEQFVDVDGDGAWSLCCDSLVGDHNANGTWDANGSIPSVAYTAGATGLATVIYVSGNDSGAVYIKATVDTDNIKATFDFPIHLTPPPVGPVNIDLDITPDFLIADGIDSALLEITVCDITGARVVDGTPILITAGEQFLDKDYNGLWTPLVDELVSDPNQNNDWDAVGSIDRYVETSGGNGAASLWYVSGTEAQTVFIRASIIDPVIGNSDEITVHLTPPPVQIYSIFLVSDSMGLSVRHTGGMETAWLRAHCFDIYGNPVTAGQKVKFSILNGPSGGEFLGTDSNASYVEVNTNSQGIAMTTVHSGIRSGTVRIRAATDSVLSNATQVLISAGPPKHVWVGAQFCNIDWWDNVGKELEVIAVVADTFNNPVNDSTVVYFTTDEGSIQSHEERTEEQEGIATTDWFSPGVVPGNDGRVIVWAETAGGTVVGSCVFFNTHVTDTLIVLGIPPFMPADGFSDAVVVVTGYDLNGNPVKGGTEFDAEANFLVAQGGLLEDGCNSASARVKLSSPTLQADYSLTGANDDGFGAVDTIIYWSGGTAASWYPIILTTDYAYSGKSSIEGPGSARWLETVYLTVKIHDRFNNPLGDHTLQMTASGGTVLAGTGETDTYGEVTNLRWQAPDSVTAAITITVQDLDPRGGIVLTKSISVAE